VAPEEVEAKLKEYEERLKRYEEFTKLPRVDV